MMPETFSAPNKPDGALRAVVWPQLALMDELTGDGRRLMSEGRGVRSLPRTVYSQFVTSYGHAGAEVSGVLSEVTFHEGGNISGRGWLLDNEAGRKQAYMLQTGGLRHNSVDLAEVEVELEWGSENPMDPGFWKLVAINFTKWKIGATTFVGVPAFPDARGELSDEEIIAALELSDEPFTLPPPSEIRIILAPDDEITASASPLPAWTDFHVPEPNGPQKITVDDNLVVTGHLAKWDSCHDGIVGRCLRVPRPADNYASFNKPGVMTDRGLVETGPLVLGGHVKALDIEAACGDTAKAWADVRVVPGIHGPWMSGRVRPGATPEMIYAGRASRVSGHWVEGRLKMICSVNAEGFDVPGSGEVRSGMGFVVDEEGEVAELFASYCGESPADPIIPGAVRDGLAEQIRKSLMGYGQLNFPPATQASLSPPAAAADDDYERTLVEVELELADTH